MLKKFLILMLVLSMLIIPANAASLTDISGNAYEEEIALLNALGIVEGRTDGAFAPDEALTRAEMVTIVLRLLNINGAEKATFEDVPENHWASTAIGTAAALGLVNGVDDTHFAPEDKLLYPQAVKMLVSALGYDVQAQALGGYPGGYLAKASQLNVLAGTLDNGAPVNRALMAKLVANSIKVNIAVRVDFGDSLKFIEKENATLLSEYLHIYKLRGTITGNETAAISGPTSRTGYIVFDNTTMMAVGETNAAGRLGEEVIVYAKLENDEYMLLHIENVANTEVVVIDAEDLTADSTTTKICYMAEDEKKEILVASDAAWIVNGDNKAADIADLSIDMGTVELVLSGETAKTVKIMSYKTLIVDTVRPDTFTVTFKNGVAEGITTLVLDPTGYKSIRFSNTEGMPMVMDALVEWDVLSVAQGRNSIEIIKNGKKVNGKISEITTEEFIINNTPYTVASEVIINGTAYEVAPCVARGIASGEIGAIGVDTEAAFLLDFTGKIVGFDGEAYRDFMYGWLVGSAEGKGVDGETQVKIFTENDEMKVFTLSDHFTLNGVPVADITEEATPVLYEEGKIAGQLVTFTANDEALTDMETQSVVASKISGHPQYSGSMYYLPSPYNCFAFKYLVRENTKLFVVPKEYSKDSDYKMVDALSIQTRAFLPNINVYDVDEYCVAGALVAVGASSDSYEKVGIVMGWGQALDADGLPCDTLNVFTTKGTESILLDEEVSIRFNADTLTTENVEGITFTKEMLRVGDFIWYSKPNDQNRVSAIHIALRNQTPYEGFAGYSDKTVTGTAKKNDDMYQSDCFTYGTVDAIKDGNAVVKHWLNGLRGAVLEARTPMSLENCTMICAYDKQENKVKEITYQEIYKGDKILSYRNNLVQSMIIVYR